MSGYELSIKKNVPEGYAFSVKKDDVVASLENLLELVKTDRCTLNKMVLTEFAKYDDYTEKTFSFSFSEKRPDHLSSETIAGLRNVLEPFQKPVDGFNVPFQKPVDGFNDSPADEDASKPEVIGDKHY